MFFPKKNNLDLLRLIFSVQVLVEHASIHMGVKLPGFIEHFPGVPAFFFISGFLIYAAYLNAPGVPYFKNRILRLYPGLVFVTIGGLAVLVMANGWSVLHKHAGELFVWFVAQTTIGQAYNPALFRDIGVGVMNGSLWTITTEILFYILVPVIVGLERKWPCAVLLLTCVSFATYVLAPYYFISPIYHQKTLYDVIKLTPLVWGWMFGFGILAVKHFDIVQRNLSLLILFAIPMLAFIFLNGQGSLFGVTGNRLGLIYYVCYISIILWISFNCPCLRLPCDLSYGIYIWHMPIINAVLSLKIRSALIVLLLTVFFAAISWYLVEQPILRLKRFSIKQI